jgi:hypothetical protein
MSNGIVKMSKMEVLKRDEEQLDYLLNGNLAAWKSLMLGTDAEVAAADNALTYAREHANRLREVRRQIHEIEAEELQAFLRGEW